MLSLLLCVLLLFVSALSFYDCFGGGGGGGGGDDDDDDECNV